jgi:hypothetical protein
VFHIIHLVLSDLRTKPGEFVLRDLALHHGTLERLFAAGKITGNNGGNGCTVHTWEKKV